MTESTKSGGVPTFGRLLMAHRSRLDALATWMTDDRAEADLAVRHAVCAAWRNPDSVPCPTELAAWLSGLMREGLARGTATQAAPPSA